MAFYRVREWTEVQKVNNWLEGEAERLTFCWSNRQVTAHLTFIITSFCREECLCFRSGRGQTPKTLSEFQRLQKASAHLLYVCSFAYLLLWQIHLGDFSLFYCSHCLSNVKPEDLRGCSSGWFNIKSHKADGQISVKFAVGVDGFQRTNLNLPDLSFWTRDVPITLFSFLILTAELALMRYQYIKNTLLFYWWDFPVWNIAELLTLC